jgi:purine nucleoside phosphorylase
LNCELPRQQRFWHHKQEDLARHTEHHCAAPGPLPQLDNLAAMAPIGVRTLVAAAANIP